MQTASAQFATKKRSRSRLLEDTLFQKVAFMFQCVQIIAKCGQVCDLQRNQIDVSGHRAGDLLGCVSILIDVTKDFIAVHQNLCCYDVRFIFRFGFHTADDIRLALVPVSKKSASVYKSVNILYKSIFAAAKESKVIQDNPTIYLSGKNGGVPQKEKNPLTDDQVERLLDAIRGLPPYVFVMLGLYAGLRREEILALQWDSVFLDEAAPYLTVCRAWHTEHNRPVIMSELKTKAAHRDVPLPDCLTKCLREAKENSTSDYVVANSEGEPLSYTQFKRLWQYIVTRTVKERSYYRYENGKRVKHTVKPVLGERAAHNGKVVYSLDFEVTPHLLRHTYITNLIHASVDPKTVQYLAGHENSKITMDIYAKAKYNRPDELAGILEDTFTLWDAE